MATTLEIYAVPTRGWKSFTSDTLIDTLIADDQRMCRIINASTQYCPERALDRLTCRAQHELFFGSRSYLIANLLLLVMRSPARASNAFTCIQRIRGRCSRDRRLNAVGQLLIAEYRHQMRRNRNPTRVEFRLFLKWRLGVMRRDWRTANDHPDR